MNRVGLISKLDLDNISLRPSKNSLSNLIKEYGLDYYKSSEYIYNLELLKNILNKNKLEIIEYFKTEKEKEAEKETEKEAETKQEKKIEKENDIEDINYKLLISWNLFDNKKLLINKLNNNEENKDVNEVECYNDEYNEYGYNEYGYNKNGYNENGYNEDGYNEDGYNEFGYNEDGYNEDGYNEDGYNEDGYNEDGYNGDGYNEDGYNEDGCNEYRYNKNDNLIDI